MAEMTDSEIVSLIGNKVYQSLNYEDGDLSQIRVENFNYYMGKPYDNERAGHSQVVTREVAETIEWTLPSVLRVFTSGDKPVAFNPVGAEDEAQADQETDMVNHALTKENGGFLEMYAWFKDCLMNPNGYIKCWVEEEEKSEVNEYQDLSLFGVAAVMQEGQARGDVEILSSETTEGPGGTSFNLEVRVTWSDTSLRIRALPPDEVLVDNDLVSVDVDQADFVCHRNQKSYTQLVNEGYDPDQLDSIGAAEDYQFLDERTNRLFHEDEDPDASDEDVPSERKYWIHECYMRIDVDGDGLSEYRRIVTIGAEVFENEETDYQPIIAMSSIPLSHKHAGLSYADLVKDLQEIKSTLWRQLLDNIYKQNVPRKYVGEGFLATAANTLDILQDNEAEFIPARDPNAMVAEQTQPIVAQILPVIQGVSDMQSVRSGVTPQMSLDPNVLQQSTFGAFGAALEQASQRVEMLVRIFAETGMTKLMRKAHQMMRQYMDRAKTIRLRGKWVEVSPAHWRERPDMTVSVGLGFNNKDHKIMLMQGLLQLQERVMPLGMTDKPGIYNALEDVVEASGLGEASRYYVDPETAPPQEPRPDPQMIAMQKQFELEQAKQQTAMEKAQLEHREKMAEFQLEREKWGAEREQMAFENEKLRAETAKILEEIGGQRLENDAAANGLTEVLNSVG